MVCTWFHVRHTFLHKNSMFGSRGPHTRLSDLQQLILLHLRPSPHYRPLEYAGSPAQPESTRSIQIQSSSNSGPSQRLTLSSIGKLEKQPSNSGPSRRYPASDSKSSRHGIRFAGPARVHDPLASESSRQRIWVRVSGPVGKSSIWVRVGGLHRNPVDIEFCSPARYDPSKYSRHRIRVRVVGPVYPPGPSTIVIEMMCSEHIISSYRNSDAIHFCPVARAVWAECIIRSTNICHPSKSSHRCHPISSVYPPLAWAPVPSS